MKKKILVLLFVIGSLFALTGCEKKESSIERVDGREFSSLANALDFYYEVYNNEPNEEIKNELMSRLEEYVLKDINGDYYWYDSGYLYLTTRNRMNRFIYVKSRDEVYIVPFENETITEDNINEVENLEQYKYKIINIELKQNNGAYNENKSVKIRFQSYLIANKTEENIDEHYKYVDFSYYSNKTEYTTDGFFAETISSIEDLSTYDGKYYVYNHYYHTKEDLEAQEAKDKAEKEKKEQLKNSIPKVGMTQDEVKQTKWGTPDKINKDTYSWGTTEQWVYNHYGYVYFRNGKVNSVSER